jgi:hypothetical protein
MPHKPINPRTPRPSRALRLSKQDFAAWGLDHAAYVRPASGKSGDTGDGKYTVHAADGRAIGTLKSRDHAIAAIVGQGMEPLSVH